MAGNPAEIPGAPHELEVMEKDDDDDTTFTGGPDMMVPGIPGQDNVFTADDEDARGQITWTLRGEDEDDFVLTNTSVNPTTGLRGPGEPITLRFAAAPDYENPTDANGDSVYKVTIVATDTPGAEDTRDLTVFVTNVNEAGDIELSTDQPLVNNEIAAMVDDPDNGLAIVTWQWEKADSAAATVWEVINGETTSTYTPVAADEGDFLRATATYTDMTSKPDNPVTVLVDERTQNSTDGTPKNAGITPDGNTDGTDSW